MTMAQSRLLAAASNQARPKRTDENTISDITVAEEKRLRLDLAIEKRKTLELQRVYDERGKQIARLEAALAPRKNLELADDDPISIHLQSLGLKPEPAPKEPS
jgi:hypothetical protein